VGAGADPEIITAAPVVHVVPAVDLLPPAMELATKYDRSIYDSLFVAAVERLGGKGITADGPLHRAVQADFPRIALLGQP
jgi:predicted nucleic acid-binding protein